MTVKELIDILQTMPQDATVMGWYNGRSVRVQKDEIEKLEWTDPPEAYVYIFDI